MASSVPKEVRSEVATVWLNEIQWKVALYTTADCLAMSVYGTTGEVASGNGYTTAGKVIEGRAASYDGNNVNFDATTDPAWIASTFTAAYALVYETSNGRVRARYDFQGNKTVTNGTFTLQLAPTGLVTIKE